MVKEGLSEVTFKLVSGREGSSHRKGLLMNVLCKWVIGKRKTLGRRKNKASLKWEIASFIQEDLCGYSIIYKGYADRNMVWGTR